MSDEKEQPLPRPFGACLMWEGSPLDGKGSLAVRTGSVSYFGSTGYQVIEPLGGGYYLVAHPNGPAICGNGYLSTIDGNDDDAIQLKVLKSHARRKFREWAWPQLVGQFFAPNNEIRDARSAFSESSGSAPSSLNLNDTK